ncbi:MAG: energy transducer TonB [Bacteroidaceae bacterium]|nr:energy transducer TonB [Bacteroidaceae bacterium]
MKVLKKKWILFYGKVLSALVALLGVMSFSTYKQMKDQHTQRLDSLKDAVRLVYGPPVVTFSDTLPAPLVDECDEGEIWEIVEQNPEFPGGPRAYLQYRAKYLRYPKEAKKKGIKGRVLVQFVVNKDGSLEPPTILRSVDPLLDAEALRFVRSMPKWKPGNLRGIPVRVKYTLPVDFPPEPLPSESDKPIWVK